MYKNQHGVSFDIKVVIALSSLSERSIAFVNFFPVFLGKNMK